MPFPDSLSSVANSPTTGALGATTPTHPQHHQALADAVNETQAALLHRARADELVFDVMDPAYGAAVDGATDDTAAWQAAINACAAAGGGVVTSSKPGVSVIAGALQDTPGANSQLTLPQIDYVDGEGITVEIRGPFPPAVVPSVIGATPIPDNHLVLKSTLASGTGALLGAVGPAGTFGSFTNLHVVLKDVSFRTVANPTNSAVDLRRAACASLSNVLVDAGSFDVLALAQPSTATSFGLRLPTNNNGATVHSDNTHIVGFYNGVEHSEHADLDIVTWGCRVGTVPTAGNHAARYRRFMAVHCTTPIKPTGALALDVEQMAVEHANSGHGWRQTTYDIDDPSNYLSGFVRWWAVLAGTGPHNVFTKNGGTGVTASRIGDAPSGGGSTQYTKRDRLTAAAGNNTLTLGTTPIADSLLLWVNGAIKWPGVDYTLAANVATFTVALSASDVVASAYQSTSASPSNASLSTAAPAINITDDFTGADSASSLNGRSTTTGSKTWTAHVGTWGISSNKAYESTNAGAINYATVDAGSANVNVQAALTPPGGGVFFGIAVRMDPATGNGFLVQFNGNQLDVLRRTGGSNTQVAGPVTHTLVAGDVLRVEMSGSSFTVKVNGSTKLTFTDSTYSTNTRHGIWTYSSTTNRWDDFSITN